MIVPPPRRTQGLEENVLPLINIVFLLLIFFMLAGALSNAAPFELHPPTASNAPPAQPPRSGVALAADGRVAFAGETIPLDSLTERARAWREDGGTSGPLTLRADAGADSERLLAVIEALRAVGIERVRLLAVGRSGEE